MATMSTASRTTVAELETIADLLKRLGNIPAARVRLRPTPGTATEQDVLKTHDRDGRICELVEGVLVEKPMGYEESQIAALLIGVLVSFVREHRLGIVSAPDGPMRMFGGQIRVPDVAFVRWERFPDGKPPRTPIADVAPDLAVEVLSKGNSRAEMDRKLREYFQSGTRLVWLVDPRKRTVRVHVGPARGQSVELTEDQTLDGGQVLPGFAVIVRELFPVEAASRLGVTEIRAIGRSLGDAEERVANRGRAGGVKIKGGKSGCTLLPKSVLTG